MKTLIEYIREQKEQEQVTSKSFTFNFKDLENAEETIDAVKDMEYVTVDDMKVTVDVNDENKDKLTAFKDAIKGYSDTLSKSSRRSSDEQYAQKIQAFEKNVKAFIDFLEAKPAEETDDDNKEEE